MIDKPYARTKEEVLEELSSDIEKGLTTSEAQRRLLEYGLNTLGEKKQTPLWKRFLLQFADAMVFILLAAAALSAVMAVKEGGFGGWVDVIVILALSLIHISEPTRLGMISYA